jgi:hypothetical protein
MKRNEIIQKLINEGFSEKTLVNFTDKQLNDLSSRMLGEQSTGRGAVIMRKGSNPSDIKKVTDSGMNVELREKEEGGLNDVDTLKSDEISKIWNHIKGGEEPSRKEMKLDIFKYMKKHDCTLNSLKDKCLKESQLEINEWVGNLAETNYHSFTSKNEIMELISMKLNESEIHEFGPNVTKGHNGIPEWFSSKSITGNNPAPVIAPPKTKPGTTPKRRTPFQPGPGPNPRPDAVMELDEFKLPQRKRDNDPIDPFRGPYKNDPMRRFNEPEEPKTNPKKKEEKKKDYPVALEVAEQQPAPVKAPPKVKPGQKPKRRTPFQPGPGPNPRPDALKEDKLVKNKK